MAQTIEEKIVIGATNNEQNTTSVKFEPKKLEGIAW